MQIQVKLYGMLRQYRPQTAAGAPHHPFTTDVGDDATVATVLDALGIPHDLVYATAVNQEAASSTTPLRPDDEVGLFPPTAGGAPAHPHP